MKYDAYVSLHHVQELYTAQVFKRLDKKGLTKFNKIILYLTSLSLCSIVIADVLLICDLPEYYLSHSCRLLVYRLVTSSASGPV